MIHTAHAFREVWWYNIEVRNKEHCSHWKPQSSGAERLGSYSLIFLHFISPRSERRCSKRRWTVKPVIGVLGDRFEALDLAVRGAGGDAGRSNKKLTVSDALVVARSPQGMRGMYTNCMLRTVRRIPAPSTLYVGDTGQRCCLRAVTWLRKRGRSTDFTGCVQIEKLGTLSPFHAIRLWLWYNGSVKEIK